MRVSAKPSWRKSAACVCMPRRVEMGAVLRAVWVLRDLATDRRKGPQLGWLVTAVTAASRRFDRILQEAADHVGVGPWTRATLTARLDLTRQRRRLESLQTSWDRDLVFAEADTLLMMLTGMTAPWTETYDSPRAARNSATSGSSGDSCLALRAHNTAR